MIAPRFPGYREMRADEILRDGDMREEPHMDRLEPAGFAGQAVGPWATGLYYRPVTEDDQLFRDCQERLTQALSGQVSLHEAAQLLTRLENREAKR